MVAVGQGLAIARVSLSQGQHGGSFPLSGPRETDMAATTTEGGIFHGGRSRIRWWASRVRPCGARMSTAHRSAHHLSSS